MDNRKLSTSGKIAQLLLALKQENEDLKKENTELKKHSTEAKRLFTSVDQKNTQLNLRIASLEQKVETLLALLHEKPGLLDAKFENQILKAQVHKLQQTPSTEEIAFAETMSLLTIEKSDEEVTRDYLDATRFKPTSMEEVQKDSVFDNKFVFMPSTSTNAPATSITNTPDSTAHYFNP